MGEDASVPTERAASIAVPARIMDGGASEWPFMRITALALANAILNARQRTLDGQKHGVSPGAITPALKEFFIR